MVLLSEMVLLKELILLKEWSLLKELLLLRELLLSPTRDCDISFFFSFSVLKVVDQCRRFRGWALEYGRLNYGVCEAEEKRGHHLLAALSANTLSNQPGHTGMRRTQLCNTRGVNPLPYR